MNNDVALSLLLMQTLWYWMNSCLNRIAYLLPECVGTVGVEALVAVHHCHEIFGVRQVDDIVGITGEHVHGLYLVTAYLELDDFISTELALLYLAMTGNDDEELPLGVVPMLAFGDAGLGNVHTELSVLCGFKKLGKTATVITIHFQIKRNFLLWQIEQIHAVQLLLKTAAAPVTSIFMTPP